MFNLEEYMNNEFLRPRENRCKWFNTFGDVKRSVYIVKGEKTQLSHKINRLNRFRQQKTDQRSMKDDTIQNIIDRFKWTQDEDWHDSNFLWIDSRQVREFCETIHTWIDSSRCESIQTVLSRFKLIQNDF